MIYRQHLCPTFSTNTNYAVEAAVIEMCKTQYPVTDGLVGNGKWEMLMICEVPLHIWRP